MPSVLISGANRGIGLEFARQYAAEGWQVIATCRNPAAATALAAIEGEIEIHPLDVGDGAAIDRLAKDLSGRPIDLLLLNAAIHPQWQRPPAEETDFDVWPEVFRINAIAPARMALAFVDNVERSDRRLIVAMSSGAGSIGRKSPGNLVYASSKAALNMNMKGLAVGWKDRGIGVIALAPGGVKTDMNQLTAARPVETAVAELRAVIDGLSPADNGRFVNFDGADMVW